MNLKEVITGPKFKYYLGVVSFLYFLGLTLSMNRSDMKRLEEKIDLVDYKIGISISATDIDSLSRVRDSLETIHTKEYWNSFWWKKIHTYEFDCSKVFR